MAPDHLSLEQRIHWSSWKSEGELRRELGLRDFDHAPTNIPPLPVYAPTNQVFYGPRSWSFYRSQISLAMHYFSTEEELYCFTKGELIKPLLELALKSDRFEQKLLKWQQFLPLAVQIGNLENITGYDHDLLKHLLKSQVSSYYELITRPFVSAALEGKGPSSDIERALVSKGLRWHSIRLLIHRHAPHRRHKEVWLMQRRSIRSAMMLLTAALQPGLSKFLPCNWIDEVEGVIITLAD